MTGWGDLAANIAGIHNVKHAVLVAPGTWGVPGTQYPIDVVNGLSEYVDDGLCYPVQIPYPASFGPIGGATNSPSYAESVGVLVENVGNWITDHPLQTFILGGYSQSAEGMSRIAIELTEGSLTSYADNFVGGYTFGNPSRLRGAHAAGTANPGSYRGIASTRMTALPTIGGRTVWADYVHSPANDDAGLDMYPCVPDNAVGDIMTDAYDMATEMQLHDPGSFTNAMVRSLTKIAYDSGLIGAFKGGFAGLFGMGEMFILGLIEDAVSGAGTPTSKADAAGMAAAEGLRFLLAPGGPTGPHISYLGEIPGYSNLVATAVGFLHDIAVAVPARCAA